MNYQQKKNFLDAVIALKKAVSMLHDVYDSDESLFNERQPDSLAACYPMSIDEWDLQLSNAVEDVEAIPFRYEISTADIFADWHEARKIQREERDLAILHKDDEALGRIYALVPKQVAMAIMDDCPIEILPKGFTNK